MLPRNDDWPMLAGEVKQGVRILAVASGTLSKTSTIMVGVIARRGVVEGIVSRTIKVDGADATAKIISMLSRSRFKEQVKVLALNGVALAGFNIVDVRTIQQTLGIRFLIITKKKPSVGEFRSALKKFCASARQAPQPRLSVLDKLSDTPFVRSGSLYVQTSGSTVAKLAPQAFEALRLAHMIARGVSEGESRGRI